MSVYRREAHRRDGRGISFGKIEQPVGTSTVSSVASENHRCTFRMLSQYNRADDAAVPVSQYSVTSSSSSSRVNGKPSDHAWNFSTSQPHSPAGESSNPYPTVCGRVDCSTEYPSSQRCACSRSESAERSAGVKSPNVDGSGAAIGGFRWMPARCAASCWASDVVIDVHQSPPWAPYRG